MPGPTRRTALATAAFVAALGWQAGTFGLETARQQWPGSAYSPRVEALLSVCATAAVDGPFAVTTIGRGTYSLATIVIGDVGHAGLVDLVCRIRGRNMDRRGLGWIALAIFVVCPLVTYWAAEFNLGLALTGTLLVRELSIASYRNVDTVALFGALVVLAVGIAVLAAGGRGLWGAIVAGGLGAFLLAERSVLAYFCVFAALASSAAVKTGRKPLFAFLMTLTVFGLAWNRVVELRARASGVIEKEALASHNTWGYLVTGIGFSANPWGIRGSDPAVVEFLARFADGPPLSMEHPENETRARRFMLHLAREEPVKLLSVYVARVPAVLAQFFSLGWFGVVGVLALLPLAWRRAAQSERRGLAAASSICVCLCAQAIVLDPRPLFSNPLLLASTLLQFAVLLPVVTTGLPARAAPPTFQA
jgi:hypothetical protein